MIKEDREEVVTVINSAADNYLAPKKSAPGSRSCPRAVVGGYFRGLSLIMAPGSNSQILFIA
jgi:hypothetical protein